VLEISLTSISNLSKCLNAVFEPGPEDCTLANWICCLFFFSIVVQLLGEFQFQFTFQFSDQKLERDQGELQADTMLSTGIFHLQTVVG